MNKTKNIDKIDLAILEYLQSNITWSARLNLRELAKKIRVPKSTIYYRLKK